MLRLATIITVLFLSHPAHANTTFTGKVVGVSDGDTIKVLHNRTPVKIRLHGVDTPEKALPFGQRAKQFTSKLVFGKVVTVTVVTKDRWGRIVGRVSVGGKSLNEALVEAGLAWWYRRYDRGNRKLAKLEAEAKEAKRGLWADQNPVAPWDWRKGKRSPAKDAKGEDCYKACLRRSSMQAVGWEHIKAQCRTQCGSSGKVEPATPPPPALPPSKDRACRRDKDCVLSPQGPCECAPCGPSWRTAINQAALRRLKARWARQRCQDRICVMCMPQWLGDKAVCNRGQCTVVQEKGQTASKGQLRCNVKSKVCHRHYCPHYRCKNRTAAFGYEAAAKKAGYRVHRGR